MVTVIAHRGASASHPPGNTLEAFRAAGPLGATWVELDVRRTADGALAVHHDAHLPDGRAIVGVAGDELPAWVPSLASALEACVGLGVNIEIKNQPGEVDFDPTEQVAGEVCRVAADSPTDQPILVSSFHLPTVDRIRELAPGLPTALLSMTMDERLLSCAVDHGHDAVHPHWMQVTEHLVRRSTEEGLAVNVWTVDAPEHLRALAGMGVSGIVTNRPDVAVRVLHADR